MKKVLLTGGYGYIGSKFIEKFSSKFNISVLDTVYYGKPLNNINFKHTHIDKDIRDVTLSDLDDIDVVVHMGELCNDPLTDLNPSLTQEINVEATQNLLDLSSKNNVQRFIYMSSCSVYGIATEDLVDEKSKVQGISTYANSKILNEEYITNNKFNFESVILRNATAYGYSTNIRLDIVVNDLVNAAIKSNKIELLSDGTPIRPLVHISDICNTVDYFIDSEQNFDKEIFNVGRSEANYSIKEIAETIGKELNISDISFFSQNPDKRSYKVSFLKIENFLEKEIFEFTLLDGIKDLIDNFKIENEFPNSRRIKKVNALIENKKLDSSLRWLT